MNRIWTTSVVLSVMALAACSVTSADSTYAGDGENRNAGAAPPSTGGTDAPSKSGSVVGTPTGDKTEAAGTADPSKTGSQGEAQAGLLTAGVWDDNLNFDFYKKYYDLSSATLTGLPTFTLAERDAARAQWTATRSPATELDIAFMIDTTGSMGDELKYLQSEIDGIAQSIKEKHPGMTPRFGLVLYKDQRDTYLTRSFDFQGLDAFRTNLMAQTVGGGGDYPEAVADGLADTLKLGWRAGAVARMTFWVADAPHHVGEETSVKSSIAAAAAKDVHVYPIAASGTDPRAEFTMRTAAQMTGGRYVFLTDDSGIGGAHAEPHIPCYHVTRFDGALVRMVESELTGTHVEPAKAEVLRSVGNPQNGTCVTASSGSVTIY